MTRDAQAARWDMAAANNELARCYEACARPAELRSAKLAAEEILARSAFGGHYSWDSQRTAAIATLLRGAVVRAEGEEASAEVRVQVNGRPREGATTNGLRST